MISQDLVCGHCQVTCSPQKTREANSRAAEGPGNAMPEEAIRKQSTLVLGNSSEQNGRMIWLMSVDF